MSPPADQGTLFAPATPSRPGRQRRPPKQTTVNVTTEAVGPGHEKDE